MKFKIDENLPVDVADALREAGYDATTVLEQRYGGSADAELATFCQLGRRVLVTLDMDFSDIKSYPPADYPGLIVLRLRKQGKPSVLNVMARLAPLLGKEPLEGRPWIVEEARIRIRR